ncbi:MAG: hypothetical protein K5739_05730 [Lachnospiraceae bacterium]|nr:hypothetical protein [Lachnospiraceae bacterium]
MNETQTKTAAMTPEERIEYARSLIQKSDNVVIMAGIGVMMECGALNFDRDTEAYRIEEQYHQCPEEIMSAGFYNVRMERFYDFYKKEILSTSLTPTATFPAIEKLYRSGKLKGVITYTIYGLHNEFDIGNVYELDGSIHDNHCSKCQKKFPMEYIRDSVGMPVCDVCGSRIRPGIRLHGERMRNDILTDAVNAVSKADVLLVLGTNLFDTNVRYAVNHYQNEKLILITKHEHFTDKAADLVIHESVCDVLPKLV